MCRFYSCEIMTFVVVITVVITVIIVKECKDMYITIA
jgi:hypothetical protein